MRERANGRSAGWGEDGEILEGMVGGERGRGWRCSWVREEERHSSEGSRRGREGGGVGDGQVRLKRSIN